MYILHHLCEDVQYFMLLDIHPKHVHDVRNICTSNVRVPHPSDNHLVYFRHTLLSLPGRFLLYCLILVCYVHCIETAAAAFSRKNNFFLSMHEQTHV